MERNRDDPSSGEAIGRFDPVKDRRILLAVSGGIAAYKSCYLTRAIRRAGGEVQVLMTAAAKEFVGALTFATLSGKPVLDDMFPSFVPAEPVHLIPVKWGELLVIAPASADLIGKLANGLADDLPSTVAMAFPGEILIAPAMNPVMWHSAAVQKNVEILRSRGFSLVGPEFGEMAGISEEAGMGRMSEPESILERIEWLLADRTRWQGRKVIVTSGPTREPLDPVRYFSNRSSGIMGDAIARQAALRGAEVTLVRGRGAAGTAPRGIKLVEVETAAEMTTAVKEGFDECDLLVMSAAVADWSPANVSPVKIKKYKGSPEIQWEETEDILAWAGKRRRRQAVVGFALETERHLEGAQQKMAQKGIDLIALNDPTKSHSTFGGLTNQLILLPRSGEVQELPVLPKRLAAEKLLDAVETYLPLT